MTNFDPIGDLPFSNPYQALSSRAAAMAKRVSAVERAAMFAAFATYAPWITPTFTAPFVNATSNAFRVYRDPTGRVFLEGDIAIGPGVTFNTDDVAFTLPEGYRPDREIYDIEVIVQSLSGGTTPSDFKLEIGGSLIATRNGPATGDAIGLLIPLPALSYRSLVTSPF